MPRFPAPYYAWLEACSSLPYAVRPVKDDAWRSYWEVVTRNGHRDSSDGTVLNAEIVAYLRAINKFRPGDSVLDVGCGMGQYSMLFARDAKKVCGLDISAEILELLRDDASKKGINNIDVAVSKWSDYAPRGKYDLVFSSFCPAVNGPAELMKMERLSSRSCCYVASAGGPRGVLYELWEALAGETFSADSNKVSYPLELLRACGRKPEINYFTEERSGPMPAGAVIDNFKAYFRMFMDVDRQKEKFISEFVQNYYDRDISEKKPGMVVGVVSWEVP
jgi:SAM-dependent methyltransferase